MVYVFKVGMVKKVLLDIMKMFDSNSFETFGDEQKYDARQQLFVIGPPTNLGSGVDSFQTARQSGTEPRPEFV